MKNVIDLILLQWIVVYFVDLAKYWRLPTSIINKLFLTRRFNSFEMKPLSCSFCSMFWAGLIYIILTGNFNLKYLALITLLSSTTTIVLDLYYWIYDWIKKILK